MKKLKKSKERMLCGVCGGIAEYLLGGFHQSGV